MRCLHMHYTQWAKGFQKCGSVKCKCELLFCFQFSYKNKTAWHSKNWMMLDDQVHKNQRLFINLDKHHSFLKISILDLGNNCELPQTYFDFSILFFFQKFRFSSIVLCAGCKMNVVYKFSKAIDSKGAPNVILFDWITKSPICKEISSKNALS